MAAKKMVVEMILMTMMSTMSEMMVMMEFVVVVTVEQLWPCPAMACRGVEPLPSWHLFARCLWIKIVLLFALQSSDWTETAPCWDAPR